MSDYQWQDSDLRQLSYAMEELTETVRELVTLMRPKPPKMQFAVGDAVVPSYGDVGSDAAWPKRVTAIDVDMTQEYPVIVTLSDGFRWSQHNLRHAAK